MSKAIDIGNRFQDLIESFKALDFLAPTAFRLYLAPVLIAAGWHKIQSIDDIAAWFGNPDWGLGLPMPELLAYLAAYTEFLGGIALVIGFAVRWISVPLMVTMLVAIFAVHWDDGWFAIAPSNPATSTASVLAPIGFPGAQESLENSEEVGRRLNLAKSILREHGDYSSLTARGNLVVLNNGIEFATTYFIMLLSLFFTGAGRFLSLDYFIRKFLREGG